MKTKFLIISLLMCSLYSFAQTTQDNYRDWTRPATGKSDKIALVIGNSRYQYARSLIYPAQDAKAVKGALSGQGYEVIEAYNLDLANFKAAINDLRKRLHEYKTLVVFYAGHGMEINGINYLLPIRANPNDVLDVEDHAIKLDYLFNRIDNPNIAKVVILDACRNNPFPNKSDADEVNRAISGSGDSEITSIHQRKKNTMIVFSTASKTTVKDNNPFAETFSQYIRSGGCIEDIMRDTRNNIAQKRSNQVVWNNSSLTSKICFGSSNSNTKDSDKDGIIDAHDKCPYEKGEIISYGCPPDPIPEGMVLVEGGEFTMGCTAEQGACEDDEKPAHKVYVDNFLMDEHEVTNEEFVAFLNSEGNRSEGGTEWYEIGSSYAKIEKQSNYYRVKSGYESHPVMEVSWYGAVAYCKWLSKKEGREYRLPTEAEWEYAARGGKYAEGYKYSGGNDLEAEAWYSPNSSGGTKPVMGKRANALGLYDMSGNVYESCSDWYGDYSSGYQRNPTGPSGGSYRVVRGGSWGYGAVYCRVADRYFSYPSLRFNFVGFRVVASPV